MMMAFDANRGTWSCRAGSLYEFEMRAKIEICIEPPLLLPMFETCLKLTTNCDFCNGVKQIFSVELFAFHAHKWLMNVAAGMIANFINRLELDEKVCEWYKFVKRGKIIIWKCLWLRIKLD